MTQTASECLHLVFLQGDLAHLSVAHKGARDLENRLSRSHSDDVVGRYEAAPLPDPPLVTQHNTHQLCVNPPLLSLMLLDSTSLVYNYIINH